MIVIQVCRDMITSIKLIHSSPDMVTIWGGVVRVFKVQSVSKLQVYNTALSIKVTMLCLRSPELTYLITEFVAFYHYLSSTLPGSYSHHSVLFHLG